MKKNLFAAVVLVALTACQKVDLPSEENGGGNFENSHVTKLFTFHVKGDFLTDYEDMTRAAVRLEDNNTAGVTDLWVLDYDANGVLVQQVHQSSTDADFGTVPMSLTYGHHDIKFVASKGDTPSLTATALAWQKVKDTFVLDYPVDVTASSNGNRAPELKRAVSGVKVVMTDKIKSGTTRIDVNVATHYASLTLPSLAVGTSAAYTNQFDVLTTDVGASLKLSTYTLAPDDAWQSDVTVSVYEGTKKVSEFVVEDVELKKNRLTELKGSVYGQGSGFSVSIDDAWEDSSVIEF